jgi:hypothetical protein
VRVKYGKFYADWRDDTGKRKAKAFATIEEALAWKEEHRRRTERGEMKRAAKARSPREQAIHRHRTKMRSKWKRRLEQTWLVLLELKYTKQQKKKLGVNGLRTTSAGELANPTWKWVTPQGKCITEKLETPEAMAQRLGL